MLQKGTILETYKCTYQLMRHAVIVKKKVGDKTLVINLKNSTNMSKFRVFKTLNSCSRRVTNLISRKCIFPFHPNKMLQIRSNQSMLYGARFMNSMHWLVLLCFFFVLCLLCLCARLFNCALWSPAGKGLTSWLSFVVSYCEFATFPLVSWVGCGT